MENLYEILRNAPDGTEIHSVPFGKLYVCNFWADRYMRKWRTGGMDEVIAFATKPRKTDRHSGEYDYRYEDVKYFFDKEGNLVFNRNYQMYHTKEDLFKPGWFYEYKGNNIFASNMHCLIFPDEQKTWHQWQNKLFQDGDVIVAEKNYYDGTSNIYTGIYKRSKNQEYSSLVYLVNVVKESIDKDRTHRFEFIGDKIAGNKFSVYIDDTRFASHQEHLAYLTHKHNTIKFGTLKRVKE